MRSRPSRSSSTGAGFIWLGIYQPLHTLAFLIPPLLELLLGLDLMHSLSTILLQQQTEKEAIREAATAKHKMHEIQAEQDLITSTLALATSSARRLAASSVLSGAGFIWLGIYQPSQTRIGSKLWAYNPQNESEWSGPSPVPKRPK
jgi:hypothetical protein